MSAREVGYEAFVNVDLTGNVDVDAYEIGPGAARLGAVTVIVEDRNAALALAQASILLQDVAQHLGRRIPSRDTSTAYDSDVTAVIAIRGAQQLRDFTLLPTGKAANGDGHARFTLGHLRLTVHDHVAAMRSSKALARAYNIAAATFGPLPELAQLRHAAERRRNARTATRPPGSAPDTNAAPNPVAGRPAERGPVPTM